MTKTVMMTTPTTAPIRNDSQDGIIKLSFSSSGPSSLHTTFKVKENHSWLGSFYLPKMTCEFLVTLYLCIPFSRKTSCDLELLARTHIVTPVHTSDHAVGRIVITIPVSSSLRW